MRGDHLETVSRQPILGLPGCSSIPSGIMKPQISYVSGRLLLQLQHSQGCLF